MTPPPGSRPRAEVAPPREATSKLYRTGYVALAASGLLLATAFGAIAQVAGPGGNTPNASGAAGVRSADRSSPESGPMLVPGQAIPGETRILIDGVAVTGTLPPSTTSPTTVVSTGPDGRTTTTVITPSRTPGNPNNPGPGPSDPDDGHGGGDGDDSSSSEAPPTSSSPESSSSTQPPSSPESSSSSEPEPSGTSTPNGSTSGDSRTSTGPS